MEREIFYNWIHDVDGNDSDGLPMQERERIENSVKGEVPGSEIRISEGSPVVVAGRPPEAVHLAVAEILKSHIGSPFFPRQTPVGTIELGVAFEKE